VISYLGVVQVETFWQVDPDGGREVLTLQEARNAIDSMVFQLLNDPAILHQESTYSDLEHAMGRIFGVETESDAEASPA